MQMAEPITVPLTTDPEELVEIARDYLRTEFPDWDPARGDQVDWVLRACAYIIAEGRDVASDVPLEIFSYLGTWLVGLPATPASYAQVTATIAVTNTAGYTITAGSRFRAVTTGDSGVIFVVSTDVVIPPGQSVTDDGEVQLIAEEAGSYANFAPTVVCEPLDSIPWITTAVFEDSTGTAVGAEGGEDAEDTDTYLGRLREEMTLLTAAPILPEDVPPLAKRVPGVGRCLPLNLYDPVTDTWDNEKTITIVITNDLGGTPSAPLKTAVKTLFESLREVNFDFNVEPPTYTQVDIGYKVKAYDGVDHGVLETSCDAAVTSYLNNLNWGRRPQAGLDALAPDWVETDKVRYGELYQVLNEVGGVNYVEFAKVALTGNSLIQQDVTLAGPGAMPTLVNLTGEVF